MNAVLKPAEQWVPVCPIDAIVPNTGVCALVEGRHVAVFRIGQNKLFAIDNLEPKTGASVMSRGLIGSLGDRVVVASPLYKHHFDLLTGECLETPDYKLHTHEVRNENGQVLVALN